MLKSNSFNQFNIMKLCILNKINENGEKDFCSAGLFEHSMSDESLLSFMINNSDVISDIWEKGQLNVEIKSVNSTPYWGYCPTNMEELDEFKRNYLLH